MIRNFKKYSLLLMLVLPSLTLANANQKIDYLANKFMQQNKVPGLSIAVIESNQISTYNYGYANELRHTKTSDKTIYRIASFSKTYAATLEAIAQIEGKVNLNDSITTYIPDLSNELLRPITIKMLVAHTASLPFDFNPSPQNYKEAINDLNNVKLQSVPGSIYGYSNVSIGLNAYILQNVYKQTYDNILQSKITHPLKLTSTYLNLPQKLETYVALGHQGEKVRPYDRRIDVWFAASSLKSNITDMAKFLQAQFNGNVGNKNLNKAFVLMHQNYYCFANGSCEQLGWQAHDISELSSDTGDTYFKNVDKDGNYVFDKQKVISGNVLQDKKVFIDKSCGGYGMSGYMLYSPQQKVGVVILLNRSLGNERIRLGRNILRIKYHESVLY